MKKTLSAIILTGLFLTSSEVLSSMRRGGFNVQKEQRRMISALRSGSRGSRYFMTVRWNVFSKTNVGAKISLIGENCTMNYYCIPALLGGFRNRDAKVRTAVYRELAMQGYSKRGLRRHRKGRVYERLIKKEIKRSERIERDRSAKQALMRFKNIFAVTVPEALRMRDVRSLAAMDPGLFIRTNAFEKMTHIGAGMQQGGKKGMNVFNLCLNAVTFRRGNIETQRYLVNEMMQAVYIFNPKEKRAMAKKVKRMMRYANDPNIRSSLDNLSKRLSR